jgi:hypothetical protein
MIIKGNARGNPKWLATHLHRTDTNESAELVEIRGLVAGDTLGALREIAATAVCTKARDPLYHSSLSPEMGQVLTPEQWHRAVDALEGKLGFTGQPRVVVRHVKKGREHCHVVWSRIDVERRRAIPDSFNFRRHEEVARELETEFGHTPTLGALVRPKREPRPARTPSRAEMMQAQKSGIDPAAVKTELTMLWRQTDTGKAFAAAIQDAGYRIARGNKRDFIVLDQAGEVHSLGRRIDGAKAADIRARMADIDPAGLPDAAGAKAIQAERAKAVIETPPPQVRAEPAKEISNAEPPYHRFDRYGKHKSGAEPPSGRSPSGTPDSLPDLHGIPMAQHLYLSDMLLPSNARGSMDVETASSGPDGLRRSGDGLTELLPTAASPVSAANERAAIVAEIAALERTIAAGAVALPSAASARKALSELSETARAESAKVGEEMSAAYQDPIAARAHWNFLRKKYGKRRAGKAVRRNPALLGALKGGARFFGLIGDPDRRAAGRAARSAVQLAISAGRSWTAYFSAKPTMEAAVAAAEARPEAVAARQATAGLAVLRATLAEIDKRDPAQVREKQVHEAVAALIDLHRSGRRQGPALETVSGLDEEGLARVRALLRQRATRNETILGGGPEKTLDRIISQQVRRQHLQTGKQVESKPRRRR